MFYNLEMPAYSASILKTVSSKKLVDFSRQKCFMHSRGKKQKKKQRRRRTENVMKCVNLEYKKNRERKGLELKRKRMAGEKKTREEGEKKLQTWRGFLAVILSIREQERQAEKKKNEKEQKK